MAVAEQPVLSSSSHNLDWYYDTYSNKLTIQLSNDASSSRRKRAIEIVDDEYQHVSLSPSIYRYSVCDNESVSLKFSNELKKSYDGA